MTMNETICNIMLFGGIALAVIFAVIAVILFIKLDIPKVIGDITGMTAKKQIQEIREKGYESVQGAGASKKEAIKAKGSSGRIAVRDIKHEEAEKKSSSEVLRKGTEKYQNAIKDLDKKKPYYEASRSEDEYEMATDVLHEENEYEEATDILGNMDMAEEATDVLSNTEYDEEATDVLSSGAYDEEATDVLSSGAYDEEATDVLSSGAYDEEATDVLSSGAYDGEATDVLSSGVYDGEATDVLSSGAYDEEVTDVLNNRAGKRADAVSRKSSLVKLVDIVVVHTDESI
jgi:hypothetical protein